jgi:manganese transport protein
VQFTSNRSRMGEFTNSRVTTAIAWAVAAAILFLNAELVYLTLRAA